MPLSAVPFVQSTEKPVAKYHGKKNSVLVTRLNVVSQTSTDRTNALQWYMPAGFSRSVNSCDRFENCGWNWFISGMPRIAETKHANNCDFVSIWISVDGEN